MSCESILIRYSDNELDRINELLPRKKCTSYRKGNKVFYYIDFPITFDIETTTMRNPLHDEDYQGKNKYLAWMYVWQIGIPLEPWDLDSKKYLCIIGRTWEEWQDFIQLLHFHYSLNEKVRLVIYVHALFFEFQFMRNFIEVESLFARHERVPLKVLANCGFEFRCSYALSNMGLSKFIKNTPGAIYNKLSGKDFDYRKIRLPNTPLSSLELEYIRNDVFGLLEALMYLLKEDDLHTIPMTSTGYVRREVREAVLSNPDNQKRIIQCRLSPALYEFCKDTSRGGNSHSNAYLANQILENVDSQDRKSSYPAEMMASKYPVSPFRLATPNIATLESYPDMAKLIDVRLLNVNMKDSMTIPYIPVAKCLEVSGTIGSGEYVINRGRVSKSLVQDEIAKRRIIIDNGRIVKAPELRMRLCDIDLGIIRRQYNFELEVIQLYLAEYGYLPVEFRQTLLKAFETKTKLERGDPYLYAKFKNKINAYFGMMLTDPCSPEILYDGNLWSMDKSQVVQKLDKYYKNRNTFLSYQHGVWVTANARLQHQLGIEACGVDIVTGDTDSCKYIGDHDKDFEKLNNQWLERVSGLDIPPIVKVWEEPTVMGLWNKEKSCDKYITMGAKKHAYIYKGESDVHITVAGLSKDDGAKWFNMNGGIESFKIGAVVPPEYSGRTVAYYNDFDKPFQLTVEGSTFTSASSIAVVDTTYKLGVSDIYEEYLDDILSGILNNTNRKETINYENVSESD